jgi:ABC-type multidrug transport system fused ATPase/permease subunit
MSRDQLKNTYKQRIAQFREAVSRQSRIINYLSLARFLALVATIWFLALGIKHSGIPFYGISFLMLVAFLALVNLHNRHNIKRELIRKLQTLNKTELDCLDHKFLDLPDGSQHADPSHPWSHDLDLFGKGSLFQYLNRTSTLRGNSILAEMLSTEPGSPEAIQTRQGIVEDLKERLDFRQNFTARGQMTKEKGDDLRDIHTWLSAPAYIRKHRWLFYLALVVSVLSLGIIVAGFFDSSRFWYLLYLLLVNYSVLSPFLMRTNQYQSVISRKHELLEGYAHLLHIIREQSFKQEELNQRAEGARQGMKEVKKLSKLLNIFDQRLNMLLGAVFNGLFLFDFLMLHFLENWKDKNSAHILEWIEITGWTDAMISLAGFASNHPDFVLPAISSRETEMELKGLGHPLIPDLKRVDNDLGIKGEKVVVITGANMAGKSTFLRSLGVNMVLAYVGCPVCATAFRSSYGGLYSSMRTADSLKDEESYFLAEIKRLQLIVKRMEEGEPLLILLDEVLKGTNTTDKKKGSVGLIQRSLNYPIRCFIATHDLSLGELEKEHKGQVVNYCFESYIKEMELSFDYTIRKGIATNMNASFLMKKMGIMD